MSDLADGESIEVQGSGAKPYVLRNVGGVFSCSCPACATSRSPSNGALASTSASCAATPPRKNESAAEVAVPRLYLDPTRAFGGLPTPARTAKQLSAPPLLLAETWDGAMDLAGWWLSEKLDGVRAYWDGERFLSRQGNTFLAPDWFTAGRTDTGDTRPTESCTSTGRI